MIAYLINQFYFKKWFTADKVPYYRLLREVVFSFKNIINCRFGNIPTHTFFLILTNEIAIFTGKLAIFCNNKCYVF